MSQPGVNAAGQSLSSVQRDGTSQAARLLRALAPDYAPIDERSFRDLLAFARDYAKELNYFSADGSPDEPQGDWRGFLDDSVDLDAIVAFMDDPSKVTPEQAQRFSRPHFVLFLTFLQLLRVAQTHLNTLTRRHIDFYFTQALRMTRKPGIPDQVNVLVDLADDVAEYPLRAGTLLSAGIDSAGQPLLYSTTGDTLVSHAQVARVRSLFARWHTTSVRDIGAKREPLAKHLFEMLEIALGDPQPGDSLPPYNGRAVDLDLLQALRSLVGLVGAALSLSFADFRTLMRLKHQRDLADAEWDEINGLLEKAGRKKHGHDPNWRLNAANPRDFAANLALALDGAPDFEHTSIPEVRTIEDLYSLRFRNLPSVRDYLHDTLFSEVDDFNRMMQIKTQIDAEWAEINRILRVAGQQKTQHEPPEPADPTDFVANLQSALGALPYVSADGKARIDDLDQYLMQLRAVERYFFMPPEDFADLLDIALDENATQQQRERFYALLDATHAQKVYAQRRERLRAIREKGSSQRAGFEAMLSDALGDAQPDAVVSSLNRLTPYIASPADIAFLQDLSASLEAHDDIRDEEWDESNRLLEKAARQRTGDPGMGLNITDKHDFDRNLANALGGALDFAPLGIPEIATVDDLYDQRFRDSVRQFIRDHLFFEDVADFYSLMRLKQQVEGEWQEVYRIVERAQRLLLEPPAAQKTEWDNLYPYDDATAVRVASAAADAEGDNPRWRTFGQATLVPLSIHPAPTVGWAITSPLLSLSEGERTITLTLAFAPANFDVVVIGSLLAAPADRQPFVVQVSTEQGWIEPDSLAPSVSADGALPALQFALTFGKKVAPLAVFPDDSFDSAAPALRLMLRQVWMMDRHDEVNGGRYVTAYQPFKNLTLVRARLEVVVSGLTPSQAQNDETALDPRKPFEPFGTNAVAGAHLYLSHPELVTRKLDSLSFRLEWMGVPKNLSDHYKNYPVANQSNATFTTRVSLVDEKLDLLLTAAAPLFELVAVNSDGTPKTDAATPHTIIVKDVPEAIRRDRPGYSYDRARHAAVADDLLNWNRYLQWELNAPGFQLDVYAGAVASKAAQLSIDIANKTVNADAETYRVSPPYTPKLKSLTLGYTSSGEIAVASHAAGLDRIFHVQPFGYAEIQPDAAGGAAFLPQFDHEGELYVGIGSPTPPKQLSLLFQVAEGSANPDSERAPVQWSYLSGNQWLSLENGSLLLDTTQGLVNSGIISFALPPAKRSTLLAPDLYWIRAAISQHSDSVCDMVAIRAQAVAAVFTDRDNAPDHLNRPLPPKRITDLAEPRSEIVGIRQPYTSFGGQSAEDDAIFYTRVSERLRHKSRALTLWDYEHMILERFPQVYKAKCLPAQPGEPGRVDVVVMPLISHKLPFNPFKPKAPVDVLGAIEAHLREHMPAYATVNVKNAHFTAVQLRFAVRFRSGYNEGYYKKVLNDELNRFLSPWAYEDGADIVIGGRIYANVIINFIEERYYVDYVSTIKLFTIEDGDLPQEVPRSADDGYWVEAGRADGVLVAAPQHQIDTLVGAPTEEETLQGINYMKIELDFKVG